MWLVIQHVESELSSTLTEAFGQTVPVVRRPYLGHVLPDVDELTGLVVLGAPGGSADDDTEHLLHERKLLREAVSVGIPVLGVCFGAQLLAVALGGSVRKAAHPRTGPGVVRYMGTTVPVMNWHHEEFVPPSEATVIAMNEFGEPRAFRFGTALGVQFHVEVDNELAEQVSHDAGRAFDDSTVAATIRAGRDLLDQFLHTSVTAPGSTTS